MSYDIKTHPDFRKYYDSRIKRNYWVLGYFGGGALNIVETYELCKLFAETTNVPIETVMVDEILYSRRYKHFKYIFSNVPDQLPENDTNIYDNVWEILTD
jgi:hypothetical protein